MSIYACLVAMACILLVLPTEASREYRRPHNRRRCMHNVGRLKWDEGLENDAQEWANRCTIQHSSGGGENLAWGSTMSYERAIELWYDEGKNYNYNSNAMDNAGHFTQVVWKDSEKIGCGIARCSFGQFVVCRYWPAGNWMGNYKQNVPPPVKSATECRV